MKNRIFDSLFHSEKNLLCLTLILVFVTILESCKQESAGLKLFVSNTGNDNWSGRIQQPSQDAKDGPFATIEAARNEIRRLKEENKFPDGIINIELQGGSYELQSVFKLDANDGGMDSETRVIYSGQAESEVKLTGGKTVKSWSRVSDTDILAMFYPEVRDKIYMADLKAFGISDFGSPEEGGAELFFNDEPMKISRYPNTGFVKINSLLNEEPVDVRGTKGDRIGKIIYGDPHLSQWKNEKDAWLYGYWFWDWSAQPQKIARINTERKLIELVPPYHNYGYRTGQWFYGFNLLSEIDVPGEYYIDRTEGIIYFYPPDPVEEGEAYVSLGKSIIQMDNVSFLTIRGMIIEGCRETAVKLVNCSNCLIADCTIRNAGDLGIEISDGNSNGAEGCTIYEVGGGGIKITGGERKTLTPANNFADNNHIHNIARLKRVYNPGISVTGVGNTISHNLIEHLPHMAVYFGGNDIIIEYNEINDVCYESNDAGAVYAGRDWTMRGNVIRYNYLRNISGFEGKGCVGIYLDDAFSSADITGNVFKNVTRAMMIGGGRDNIVTNNVFVDCVPSIHVDARGLGWMKDSHIPDWIKEAEEKGTIFGIAYNKPPFSERYPALVNILNDEPRAPKGNVISNNVCLGGVWDKAAGFWRMSIEDKARPYLTMKDNVVSPETTVEDSLSKSLIITDPLFENQTDPEQADYQLNFNSPALKLGFSQIPFNMIGLYQNEYRKVLPASDNYK